MKKSFSILCASLMLMAILTVARTSNAAPITFSEFPVGTLISNQYAGVTFYAGANGNLPIIANDGAMPGSPVLSPNPVFAGDFWMNFTTAVSDVSFDSGYWDTRGSGAITVYDIGFNLLANATNLGLGPEAMLFTALGPISWIHFDSRLDPAGADIDNLDFRAVPEPSTLLLLGSGLLGLGYFSRKRFLS